MSKLIGLVITAAAFCVAAYLVLRRRRPAARKPSSLLTARFWVLVTLFVGMLGGAPQDTAASSQHKDSMNEQTSSRLSAKAEWQQIKKDWLAVQEQSGFGWDEMKARVAAAEKKCAERMQPLTTAGLVEKETAEVFCRIYSGRIYHKLRAMAASCYDPTMLGAKVQAHRDDFEKRLKALAKLAADAKLKAGVVEKIRRVIARQMEFSLRVDDHWKAMPKKGPWDDYRKREQELMGWFAKDDYKTIELKADLPVRSAVKQALELVKLIYQR